MSLALAILGWILVAVLLVLAAAIFLPLRLEMRAVADGALTVSAALRPFGRYGPRIPLKPSAKKEAKPRPKKARRARGRTLRRAGRDPRRLVAAALGLARDLIRLVRIETASLDLRFGCADPGETGQIFGLMTPFIYGTGAVPRTHLRVEPVFEGAVFDGRAALDLSLVPARLVPVAVRFGWAAFGPHR